MKLIFVVMATAIILGIEAGAWGSNGPDTFQRNRDYEQDLRYDASPDKVLTPAKAIRWIMGLQGHPNLSLPSPTEFQPVVQVHDGRVRVLGVLAYKF